MCLEPRQKIRLFFNLFLANAETQVSAAGSDGGTAKEAISSELKMISFTVA